MLLELQRDGEDVEADIEKLVSQLEQEINEIEMTMKFSGEHDDRDAIVAIHPGAGGTESQDWAEMLLRMYLRFCERRRWSTEMVEYQAGEEAGIKSATFMVRGDYAYGYLKSEHGVHRLVRISPFDAAKRRHTSFASVYVFPDIDEEICASTRTAPPAPVGSTSTSPTRRCASPICRAASWSPARTSGASTRTAMWR